MLGEGDRQSQPEMQKLRLQRRRLYVYRRRKDDTGRPQAHSASTTDDLF